jgi:hypothetical protein
MDKQSRKHLSASALLTMTMKLFKGLPDQIMGKRKEPITLADCLMSALAMFSIKSKSLLAFNEAYNHDKALEHNLRTLFSVNRVPSDTYMRERLDLVDPQDIRGAFTNIFAQLQRGKALEQYQFFEGYYLISLDGTGYFLSNTTYCDNCCVKQHKDGTKSYYHQLFAGSIVHPGLNTVIPLAPEPIMKADGQSKNDCEFNAAKRFIKHFRREHPHLKTIIVADSLHSKGPFIKELQAADMSFILNAKPGDHKKLFEFVQGISTNITRKTRGGIVQQYRYANSVPINDSNYDLAVNFLEYTETNHKGKTLRFSWVTNIEITEENIHQIVQGGRARWKIENETFNTLKNQGYEFEHNFGHGYKHLSTVFAMLMMLAFLIDQTQELCDALFQAALKASRRRSYFWNRLSRLFHEFLIDSWEDLWAAMANQDKKIPRLNSS